MQDGPNSRSHNGALPSCNLSDWIVVVLFRIGFGGVHKRFASMQFHDRRYIVVVFPVDEQSLQPQTVPPQVPKMPNFKRVKNTYFAITHVNALISEVQKSKFNSFTRKMN